MNSKFPITLAVCVFLLLGVTLLAVQSTRKAARSGREAAAARAEAAALRQQLQEPSGNQAAPVTGMDPDVWRARVNRLQAQLEEKDRLIASLQKPGEAAPPTGPICTFAGRMQPGTPAAGSPAEVDLEGAVQQNEPHQVGGRHGLAAADAGAQRRVRHRAKRLRPRCRAGCRCANLSTERPAERFGPRVRWRG